MKQLLFITLVLLINQSLNAQNILVVDNTELTPSGDNYYTSLQTAITEAEQGDIIYVIPSTKNYGSIDIFSKTNLTIVGGGYNSGAGSKHNPYDSRVVNVDMRNSINVVLKGINIAGVNGMDIGPVTDGASMNIYISECVITVLGISRADGVTIVNSFISTNFFTSSSSATNISVKNSVISESSTFTNVHNTSFENNLFVGMKLASTVENNIFKNNIFAGNTTDIEGHIWSNRGNTFINNFSSTLIDWVGGSNTGEDNIFNSMQLENIFTDDSVRSNTDWSLDWLLTTENAFFENRGPSKGSNPMDGSPIFSLPTIYELIAPTTLKEGEDTEITIKARGN